MGKDAERFLYEISHLPSEEKRRAERARIESEAQQLVAMVRNIKYKNQDNVLGEKIQSLIGVIPPFSQEEIDSDERLKHILIHL